MGAELWLGKFKENEKGKIEETEDIFKVQGYFGVNPTDPTENYVYARSYGQKLTIGNLAKAFGSTMKIPEPIAMSGFCGELKFSLSMSENGQLFFVCFVYCFKAKLQFKYTRIVHLQYTNKD